MPSEQETEAYAVGAVFTGRISITSNSEAVAVLTKSGTWSYFVYGAMEWHTDSLPPRYTLGNLCWCLVDTPPPLPLCDTVLRNYAAVASFAQRSTTSAYYGSTA